jgi:Flp pilus assembly protein TadD/4-amino-4-deoxy-L-arabinose transferase-like glycosyltransferase
VTPKRFFPIAVVIFVVSLTVRLIHLYQIRRAPFFTLLMGDAQSYHAWAQRLAAGDWIGSDVFYQAPLYPYFLGLVYTLLGEAPMTVRLFQAVIGSLACVLLAFAAWRLFSRPAGIAAGLMLAFYAPAIFFDGVIQKSVLDIFLLCLALALLSGLISPAEAGHHVPQVGSGFPPPLAGEPGELRRGSPKRQRREGGSRITGWMASRHWSWLFLGLTMGALALTRENAMVLVIVILGWIALRPESAGANQRRPEPIRLKPDPTAQQSSRVKAAGAFLLGMTLLLLPVAARNKAVSGEFHLTTSQFGPNFYIGNNENASGTYQPLRFGHGDPKYERQDATELAEQATGRRLTPGEVSRYWTWRALEYIRTQPRDWLALMGRKTMLAWNAAEVADTEDERSYADWSVPLRVASRVWHFGILAPLALIGIWTTWPRRTDLWLLYLLPAAYVLALLAFAVMARYRYPLVPFLILFASAAVANAGQLLRATPRRLAPGLAAAILFAVFCNWPMHSMAEMRAITESNVGTELQAQGRLDEAIAFYRAALARDPKDAVTHSNLGTALAARGQLDEAIAQYQTALSLAPNDADSHYNLANALLAQGKIVDAVAQFRDALRIEPGLPEAHLNLGNALAELGETEEASDHYRRAIELRPKQVEALNNLGLLLAAEGRRDDAMALFRRALAINADFADAHTNLGSTLREAGAFAEAVTHFRRAVELLPESADVRNDLGVILAQQNQLDDAIGQFREAIRLAPRHDEAHGNLAMALQIQGKLEEAIDHYQEAARLSPGNAEMEKRLRAARAARQ